jgi:signal transduction histidine kinase
MSMDTAKKLAVIKQTSLFESLSEEDFQQIAEVATVSEFKPGDIIFEENAGADAFYIIAEGEVEILKLSRDGRQEILAVKKDGDVFGEMAVIDDLPRSATIRAKNDLKLLKLSKNLFTELLKNFSHISLEIARNICSTVRNTNSNYIGDLEIRNKQLQIAYSKLKKTQAELIRAEKMSVVGKFSSLIIHDIKNPLSNIRAYAELISMTASDHEKAEKSSQVIMKEVDRLTRMAEELLEFARGEINLNKTPVNLSSLTESLIDTIKEDFKKKNVQIVFKERMNSVVMLDAEKMKRVFFNLISNAADACLGEGRILIKVVDDGKWVNWSFQDNGIGMDQETLNQIFEPFFTRGKKKGTGLGMAIVKGIIESHNGIIKAFSKKDTGTKFTILLPKA